MVRGCMEDGEKTSVEGWRQEEKGEGERRLRREWLAHSGLRGAPVVPLILIGAHHSRWTAYHWRTWPENYRPRLEEREGGRRKGQRDQ